MRPYQAIYEHPDFQMSPKEAASAQSTMYRLGGLVLVVAIASFNVWYFALWETIHVNLFS